jgi:hypothetical protein
MGANKSKQAEFQAENIKLRAELQLQLKRQAQVELQLRAELQAENIKLRAELQLQLERQAQVELQHRAELQRHVEREIEQRIETADLIRDCLEVASLAEAQASSQLLRRIIRNLIRIRRWGEAALVYRVLTKRTGNWDPIFFLRLTDFMLLCFLLQQNGRGTGANLDGAGGSHGGQECRLCEAAIQADEGESKCSGSRSVSSGQGAGLWVSAEGMKDQPCHYVLDYLSWLQERRALLSCSAPCRMFR